MQAVADHSMLIQAARSGDPTAIARLLTVCQADARRYARRHCLASDVDDAVQASLITVMNKVGALRAAAAFSSWLFVMVRRECLRLQRLVARHDSLDDGLDTGETERQLASRPDEALRFDLIKALESLPAHYLEVVLLRDFEELTIAEMAIRLGEPAGAVRSRLHRARALVREYLLGH